MQHYNLQLYFISNKNTHFKMNNSRWFELFNLEMHIYLDRPEIIKSSKNKDGLFEGHYYDQINILNTSNVEQ